MSALTISPLQKRANNQIPCENNYTEQHIGVKRASFKASICDWPIGLYCPACATQLEADWENALNPDENLQVAA